MQCTTQVSVITHCNCPHETQKYPTKSGRVYIIFLACVTPVWLTPYPLHASLPKCKLAPIQYLLHLFLNIRLLSTGSPNAHYFSPWISTWGTHKKAAAKLGDGTRSRLYTEIIQSNLEDYQAGYIFPNTPFFKYCICSGLPMATGLPWQA